MSLGKQSKRGGSTSARFSMADNLDRFDLTQSSIDFAANTSRFSYQSSTATAAAMMNTGMQKIGKSLGSTIRTDRGNAFSRANDRFQAPTLNKLSPPPNAYHISDSIGYTD